MNNIKNWVIVVLGIIIIILSWRIKQQQIFISSIDTTDIDYYNATEAVIDEVCDYVEEKYGEYLPDTLWEGDIYDNYMSVRMKYIQ